MTEDQIKHMTNRFLSWRLPDNFHPDAGISFTPEANVGTAHPYRHQPVGTNLFTATQAEAMVRHLADGLPAKQDASATSLAADFRRRAHACRTNMDGYDASAASIWDLAAEAAEAMR